MHRFVVVFILCLGISVQALAKNEDFKPSPRDSSSTESRGFWSRGFFGTIKDFFGGSSSSKNPPNWPQKPLNTFAHRRTSAEGPQRPSYQSHRRNPQRRQASPPKKFTYMRPPPAKPKFQTVKKDLNRPPSHQHSFNLDRADLQRPPSKPTMTTALMNRFTSIKDNFLGSLSPAKTKRKPVPVKHLLASPSNSVQSFVASQFLPSPKEGNMAHDAFQPVFQPSISLDNALPKEAMKPMENVQKPKVVERKTPEPELVSFHR